MNVQLVDSNFNSLYQRRFLLIYGSKVIQETKHNDPENI